MYNNYLQHYGILGMKWGRRRTDSSITRPTTTIRRTSEDHDKRMSLKGKKLHELSNDELRMYTQRMALEKQYKELSKADISFGKKLVNDMINSAKKGATDMALSYVNKQAAKMVEELLKKTMKAAK